MSKSGSAVAALRLLFKGTKGTAGNELESQRILNELLREGKLVVQKSLGSQSKLEIVLPGEAIPIQASKANDTFQYKTSLKNVTVKLHISSGDWERHMRNSTGVAGIERPFEKVSSVVVGFTMVEYILKAFRFVKDLKKNPDLALKGLHENIVDKKLMERRIQKIDLLVSKIADNLGIEEEDSAMKGKGARENKGAGENKGNTGKTGGDEGKNGGDEGKNGKGQIKKDEGKNGNGRTKDEGENEGKNGKGKIKKDKGKNGNGKTKDEEENEGNSSGSEDESE